ncbi:MAG: class I SAM-dependent rRNA methyltransferase, partial [Mesorhizobium sp.]
MKPFRDKRRDSRSHQLAKGGAEPRGTGASGNRTEPIAAPRVLSRRDGALPAEHLPLILEVAPNADYALLDSGAGQKLEQYGPYRIVRPEGQAIWQKALPAKDWDRA